MTTLSTAQAEERFRASAYTDLSNVSCDALQNRLSACNINSVIDAGVKLVLPSSQAITNTDLLSYPNTSAWPDVSALVQAAFNSGRDAKAIVNAMDQSGMYFIDKATALLIYQGSGFLGPIQQPCQLSYTTVGGVLKQQVINPGLTFIIDCRSTNRNVPWFARQGNTHIDGLQVAGFGLIEDAAGINVTGYPTIVGSPTDHAPVIVTDHKHDAAGNVVTSAKAGNTYLRAHIVGVMQSAYHGDPLISEEPWCASTASGLQTGVSFSEIYLTGNALKRVLGVARSTTGSLKVEIQNIPPWWTAISQPNSGGLTNYALLKWQQSNCRIVDMWHRSVGIQIAIRARGCRYGVYMQAGANALGPAGQDTGKYNQGDISVKGERIITALHIEPNAYGHDLDVYVRGHFMNPYNYSGENGSVFEILTDGAVAGAIDKAVYDLAVIGRDYAIDEKVSDGSSNVFDCQQAGLCSIVPTTSGPNYNATTKRYTDPVAGGPIWVFRNGGFKPVGAQPFAAITYRGKILEAAGRVFMNTAADGHLEHEMNGLSFQNWSQAKLSHANAAILNASTTTILIHTNSRTGASGSSKRVYDVANPQNLVVGNDRHYGQVIPLDADNNPTGVFPTAVGGNLLESFWWNKNVQAFSAGTAMGDDDEEDPNG
jgi:hypothetical protein